MIPEYNEAKKQARAAVKTAVKSGHSPYLPVLDDMEDVKNAVGEVHLGLLELPLDRISGNKEASRNNAFANNFLPLLEENTEFAQKWENLYKSYQKEGIREAIKVYEFMNRYYVQEGNKRVSVSKFCGSEFILADVTRIIPKRTDDKDVAVYYEYLEFYKSTKNIHIVFTAPGSYLRLAELLGQELGSRWDKQLCDDLKYVYFSFCDKCKSVLKLPPKYTMGDAFLVYISIFPMRSLLEDSADRIINNIKLARRELFTGLDTGAIEFVSQAPEQEKSACLFSIFSGGRKYTESAPLRVGFIYDSDIESSRWIDSHEAGRVYIDYVTEKNVVTSVYYANDDLPAALEQAVDEKNELIFAVSPSMLTDTLRAAVNHPKVRFFNCCIGKPHPMVRCYHGRLYEAAFLAGILSADTLLRKNAGSKRRIGYLMRTSDEMSAATVNAFAVGVSLLDPECRISLKQIGEQTEEDIRREWKEQDIRLIADIEYPAFSGSIRKPGVFWSEDGKETCIGTPYFKWGKYYEQIVQSMLSGALHAAELVNEMIARNYWFGLSADVVDLRAPGLPYQTKKLLDFFRSAVISGGMEPFSGELHTQETCIQERGVASTETNNQLSAQKIISMDWLNENIDGTLRIPAVI